MIRRAEIEKKIAESVKAQVNMDVEDWGKSVETKKFVENLKRMMQENNVLHREAQVKLHNW